MGYTEFKNINNFEDIEDNDIENIFSNIKNANKDIKLKLFTKELIMTCGLPSIEITSDKVQSKINSLKKKYKINPNKPMMRMAYEKYYAETYPELNHIFGRYLIKKSMRSKSGVLVCTVVLKPDKFSCPKKCSYCPTETDLHGNPTQPKSYLSSEPAMLRALQYNFDVKGQIWDRIKAYIHTGNIIEHNENLSDICPDNLSYKLEIILSGGTWESYSYEYRNMVMNEIYYATNTFCKNGEKDRSILSLEEEIKINEKEKYRIIGLTIETRPDFITKQSIRDYRRWGVTRLQIGVQHYDDDILHKINRECYTIDTIKAIKMLKQCGFKIVCHLMPDLPGSSPEKDKWMFEQSIINPDLQFDDIKIYPTAVCKSDNDKLIVKSDIAEWYASGEYIPYAEKNLKDLIDVLKYYKMNIQPWVRIQRLVRDIPERSMEAGYEKISNLRQIIQDSMKKEGVKCNCIRCMEVRDDDYKMNKAKLVVREFRASEEKEYYISYEYNNFGGLFNINSILYLWFLIKYYINLYLFSNIIYWGGNMKTYDGLIGFCRLRLDTDPGINGVIPELKDCALIREVHVYGYSLGVGSNNRNINDNKKDNREKLNSTQHKGFGKRLVKTAEDIAKKNGFNKVAIIAGVGTREYYKNKCGYHLEGTYMIKEI
jgi:ELP3 family radical SAM enzyme/protein acetyltransferase